jgi:cytochrome oxidase assembly protein ShyY1
MTVGQLLRTRRWMGLTLLALVVVVTFVGLGKWQFDRSYRLPDGFTDEPPAVALVAVSPPGGALPATLVGRQATASGQYDAAGQRLLPGHSLDGAPVQWVVTPLRLTDGSTVDVVRGWLAGAEAGLDAPPSGTVEVTGRLRPPDLSVTGPVPAEGRSAYLVRTAQSPPDPLSLQPVPSSPPSSSAGTRQFHLQNAIYTSQWWIFAVLVVVYWWRLLRTEQEVEHTAADELPSPA